MSRIGNKPITIPSGVEVTIGEQNTVEVKGPKGTLSGQFHPNLTITQENGTLSVVRPDDAREHRAVHGLTRTLINNMVVGVTEGFKKNLEIQGVGYRAAIDGKTLVLNVGYSHPVRMNPGEGVMFAVDGPNKIIVSGADKQRVGEEAARIHRTRPPEPYKGKGIRYEGEYVRRKAGKTGKAK
jgi:large subunit ribosomal protein L6